MAVWLNGVENSRRYDLFMDQPPPWPRPPVIVPEVVTAMTPQELRQLAYAKSVLETPGLAIRLANRLGKPIEHGVRLLPEGWQVMVQNASRSALMRALDAAMATMNPRARKRASERFHKLLVGASGGVGGMFGLASLPLELPVSTTIMLRSIADIARSEGQDLRHPSVKLACLEVFALGGRSTADDAVESSYWAVRAALAKAISEAATFLTERGFLEKTAPAVVRLIAAIAARFGVVVSEQVAAKAVPVVGAAGGAMINMVFMNHFQDMARGHFIVKRLEAKYGQELVRQAYGGLPGTAKLESRAG